MRNRPPAKIIQKIRLCNIFMKTETILKIMRYILSLMHLKKEPIMKYDRFLFCYIGGSILTHQLKKLIVPKNEKMSQNLINNCGGVNFSLWG